MSHPLMRHVFLGALLLSLPLLAGAASQEEPLAGEQEEAAPTPSKAGAALPEESAPMSATRTARPVAAFQLPEFVISGGGEKKALTGRGSLQYGVDTSGGFKASPGEEGASKGQMQVQAQRQDLGELSATAKPGYGQARMAYGLRNSMDVDAFYGRQAGPWAFLARGDAAMSDGGELPELLPALAQSGREGLGLRVSRELSDGGQASLQGDARWRRRFWTRSSLPAPRLERFLGVAQGAWEGGGAWRPRVSVEGQHAWSGLPGLGLVYAEDFGRVQLQLSRLVAGRTGSALLEGGAEFGSQAVSTPLGRRLLPWRAWVDSGFRPWAGGRLQLGVSADGVSGDADELLISPRLRLDQRLGARSGLFASTQGGIDLPSLRGAAFELDTVLPDPRLRPSRRVVDAELGLTHAPAPAWRLELTGFVRQNEEAFMPDDPLRSGLWLQTRVKTLRLLGLRLGQSWEGPSGWSQEAGLVLRQAMLLDLGHLSPTFVPVWEASFKVGRHWGPWSASLSLLARAESNASLNGSSSAPAFADLGAGLRYDVNRALSLLAEGRNLLAQSRQEQPGYAEAAPYLGIGALLRF